MFTHFVLSFIAAKGLADDCRVGHGDSRPYSGATVVCDFCAHPHRDVNNMHGGCTTVITLTKPENMDMGSNDEQLHGKIHTSLSQIDKITKWLKSNSHHLILVLYLSRLKSLVLELICLLKNDDEKWVSIFLF